MTTKTTTPVALAPDRRNLDPVKPVIYPASYPLSTLVEAPAEWALNLMADLYQADIKGTHGFGVRHPRAPWLLLVVSSVERCACGERARWEEMGGPAFCPRCAEAEIALVAAEQLRREDGVPEPVPAYETEPTQVEAFVPMAHLPRPEAKRAAEEMGLINDGAI